MGEAVEITAQKRSIQFGIRQLLIAVSVIAAILAVVVPLYRRSRFASERMQCSNHLKHIALGLQNYHDTFQSFPAAWQIDSTGAPAHSWRVAIWPFMMNDHRYHLYDYAETWNGPHNSKLDTRLADVYCCPSDRSHKRGMTSYVAVVGPGTAWPGTGYSSMSDLWDGTANTVMVVEIVNSDIHWMEPRDLPIEELTEWLKPSHKPSLGTSHRSSSVSGCLAVFADGHTAYYPRSEMTEKRLRGLLSPAGNDTADAED